MLTIHPQTELELNTYVAVSDVRDGVTKIHTAVSEVQRGVTDTYGVVTDIRQLLESREAVDEERRSVSNGLIVLATRSILTVAKNQTGLATSATIESSPLHSHLAHLANRPLLYQEPVSDATSWLRR